MRSPAGPNNRITQTSHLASRAVDYSARPDRNIYAPEDMRITESRVAGACGNLLRGVGKTGTHTFCHLERETVKVDQRVKKGQVIGIMGYSGYTIPSGPAGRHLHYYVKTDKGYVYPPKLITEEVEVASERFIKQAYRAVLGRKADKGGLAHYQKPRYNDPEFILNDLFNSKERERYVERERAQDKARAVLSKQVDSLSTKNKVYKSDLQAAHDETAKVVKELEEAEEALRLAQDSPVQPEEPEPVEDQSTALKRLIDGAAELIQVIINKLTGGTKQ